MMCRRVVIASALFALTIPAHAANQGMADQPERLLTNEGLVMLARAGYNERFLSELVHAKPYRFDTSVEGLVYLAKQGVSEKMVRLILAMQKSADSREAEHAAAEAAGEHEAPLHAEPAPAPAAARPGPSLPRAKMQPVRMRVVTQKMLVPENQAMQLGPNTTIIVEKRRLGADRYYAMPGAQQPLVSPIAVPKQNQKVAAAAVEMATPVTRVAAFH